MARAAGKCRMTSGGWYPMERELAVIDHRERSSQGRSSHRSDNDHPIRDHTPKVSVFTDSANGHSTNAPLKTAAVKRHRFVQNLKNNHQKFSEALAFVERFAVICELSEERVNAIRKAKADAVEELSKRFEEKLKVYDERIRGESA